MAERSFLEKLGYAIGQTAQGVPDLLRVQQQQRQEQQQIQQQMQQQQFQNLMAERGMGLDEMLANFKMQQQPEKPEPSAQAKQINELMAGGTSREEAIRLVYKVKKDAPDKPVPPRNLAKEVFETLNKKLPAWGTDKTAWTKISAHSGIPYPVPKPTAMGIYGENIKHELPRLQEQDPTSYANIADSLPQLIQQLVAQRQPAAQPDTTATQSQDNGFWGIKLPNLFQGLQFEDKSIPPIPDTWDGTQEQWIDYLKKTGKLQ